MPLHRLGSQGRKASGPSARARRQCALPARRPAGLPRCACLSLAPKATSAVGWRPYLCHAVTVVRGLDTGLLSRWLAVHGYRSAGTGDHDSVTRICARCRRATSKTRRRPASGGAVERSAGRKQARTSRTRSTTRVRSASQNWPRPRVSGASSTPRRAASTASVRASSSTRRPRSIRRRPTHAARSWSNAIVAQLADAALLRRVPAQCDGLRSVAAHALRHRAQRPLCARVHDAAPIAMTSDGTPWRPRGARRGHLPGICLCARGARRCGQRRDFQRRVDGRELPHPRTGRDRRRGVPGLRTERRPERRRQPQLPRVVRKNRTRSYPASRAAGRRGRRRRTASTVQAHRVR